MCVWRDIESLVQSTTAGVSKGSLTQLDREDMEHQFGGGCVCVCVCVCVNMAAV